ncbi:hypothetical protein BKA65DRAFT_215444 [Rhexocercosporidium sp. MPI-PUGE-AT-0058]|nr:hypothetical protein BKA65DRAFT_215444 [Rhexocercosporidium sp. MPI-PUGE-AT-0058]
MMNRLVLHFLLLSVASLATIVQANPQQKHLSIMKTMADSEAEKVPGHNNATYSPVPKEEQLFSVEFLEIAPTPMIADRVFFIYLRGYMPSNIKIPSEDETPKFPVSGPTPDPYLQNATLVLTSSVTYADKTHITHSPLTIPFKSTVFNDAAHLVIRDEKGKEVEFLPRVGRVDLLLDFQIPWVFLRSGFWRFGVEGRVVEGGKCLFAFEFVQWLDGGMR